MRRDRLVWVGIDRIQLDELQPVPLITYHAPSFSRAAAIDALGSAHRSWRITCNTREINGVLAATRAGIGICVLAQSRVPQDLRVLSGRFGLPPLADVEMALIANPRSAGGPVEALSKSILNLPLAPLRPDRSRQSRFETTRSAGRDRVRGLRDRAFPDAFLAYTRTTYLAFFFSPAIFLLSTLDDTATVFFFPFDLRIAVT